MNRTLLLGAAWIASAGAAVGLGFLAVSLVDASASSPGVQPVSTSVTGGAESTDATASPSPSVSPAPTSQMRTAAGTVVASCGEGATVPVLSGAPAPGWWPDDRREPGKLEFKSATQSLEVRATCVDGVPQFVVGDVRADNNSGGDDAVVTDDNRRGSATPAAPSSDDNGGQRGGHGADDPPGDDHGGGANSGSGSGNSGSGSGDSGSGSGGSGSGGHGSDD